MKMVALQLAVVLFTLTACAQNPSFVGSWGYAGQEGMPALEINADGSVVGTDGCNQLFGSWTLSQQTVIFENLASTKMFCEGVDDWLSQAHSASISSNLITFRDAQGDEIGVLPRAD